MKKGQPNIFLITIDSLRADHCQFLGYPRKTTPFLDSIAKNSVVFPNFYANSIPTFFAFPTILTGKKPFIAGEFLGISDGVDTIAEIFKKEGYINCAFVGNNPALYEEFGYNRGFDVFESFREYKTSRHQSFREHKTSKLKPLKQFAKRILPNALRPIHGYPPNAVELTSHVVESLKEHKHVPVFCWVHYMDVHGPYINGYNRFVDVHSRKPSLFQLRTAVGNYVAQRGCPETPKFISVSDLNLTQDLYDAAVNYVDLQIQRLTTEINQLFRDCENFFFITSDHGEAFMEHGYVYHQPWGLHNELIKVPLLIFSSKSEVKEIIEHPLGHTDLLKMMMTVAKECRLAVPDRDGYLISEIPYGCASPVSKIRDNRTKIGDYDKMASVIVNGYKYIINYKTGFEELYNTAVDPAEKLNILEQHKNLASEMLGMYEEWDRQRAKAKSSLKRKSLAQRVKRLRTL